MHPAINSVSNPISLFKGTKRLCQMRGSSESCTDVSVQFTPEDYEKYILPLLINKPDHSVAMQSRCFFLHYSKVTGIFLHSNLDPDSIDYEIVDDFLSNTRIVDTFNFEWGLLNGFFWGFEGYSKKNPLVAERIRESECIMFDNGGSAKRIAHGKPHWQCYTSFGLPFKAVMDDFGELKPIPGEGIQIHLVVHD